MCVVSVDERIRAAIEAHVQEYHKTSPAERADVEDITLLDAMYTLGLKTDPTFAQHFLVLLRAQRIYEDRFDKYQDAPIRAMGWRGCISEARKLIDRWSALWERNRDPDDPLDLINYTVHAIRLSEAENGQSTPEQELDESGSGEHEPPRA